MRTRDGFTLVELLVVVVLGGLVLAGIFQVLVSNQQIYTAQSASVLGQQTVRGGIELLSTEIRELSPTEGDLLDISDPNRIEMRVMRGVAVACGINGIDPLEVRASIMGAPFSAGDSVWVYADGSDVPEEHFWTRGVVSSTPATGTPANCGGENSRRLVIEELDPPVVASGQVGSGMLVRSFETVTYAPVTLGNETFLGRIIGGSEEPLIGPIAPADGVRFEYLDADGDPTTNATQVRSVRITVRTLSGARDRGGNPISDSLSVFVNPRN